MATPVAFPSFEPKVVKSDLQIGRFNGKIKNVIQESEDLTGEWYSIGRVLSFEDSYSYNGNRTKSVQFNHRGFPTAVTVYGFLGNDRVKKSGSIDYESTLPSILVKIPKSVKNLKPRKVDERYDSKTVQKFGKDLELVAESLFYNDGEIAGKALFKRIGNTVEQTGYGSDGKITNTQTITFDERGLEIAKEISWGSARKLPSKYNYTYESFDSAGNWTKRLVDGIEHGYGGRIIVQKYYQYRKIVYYE